MKQSFGNFEYYVNVLHFFNVFMNNNVKKGLPLVVT